MKALIRRKHEVVLENDGIEGIDWKTGAPLTRMEWFGGPYTLVNDYVPEDPTRDFSAIPTPASAQDPVIEEVPDTIVIDGVTYTRTP